MAMPPSSSPKSHEDGLRSFVVPHVVGVFAKIDGLSKGVGCAVIHFHLSARLSRYWHPRSLTSSRFYYISPLDGYTLECSPESTSFFVARSPSRQRVFSRLPPAGAAFHVQQTKMKSRPQAKAQLVKICDAYEDLFWLYRGRKPLLLRSSAKCCGASGL
jgi:hypothetical protein